MHVMQSITYFRMRLREKINDGRIASTRHSDSDSTDVQEEIQVESEPAPKKRCLRKTWQRFIGVLKGQSSRDTSCNHSLCVTNEASSERWGALASSNLTRLWGRPLSPSPVRLSIPLQLDERAFWVSVKLCTLLLRNTRFGSSLANNFDFDGTQVYAVVTCSFAALPLISSCLGQYSIKLVWAHTRWPHSLWERDKTAFLNYMSDYSCSVYAQYCNKFTTAWYCKHPWVLELILGGA